MSFFSDIFGFRVATKNDRGEQLQSVVAPTNYDGAVVFDHAVSAGGWQGYAFDTDASIKTENDQIARYRSTAAFPEVDIAIEDIVNEAIVSDQEDYPVKLQLDNLKVSEPLKKKFQESFQEVLNKLSFNDQGHDIFRQWYIDGRTYYHILFDEKNVKQGIAELRRIDPLKIKKIKNIHKKKTERGVEIVDRVEEYYVYNDKGISETAIQGIKMSLDSVAMISSGMVDPVNGMVLGHLQKAIKPANQLRMLEDAIVIHTLTRAPDRRIFYVDVGTLPKLKAEQYVKEQMDRFKNKLIYNATTGEIADAKKNISMIEDFWMPRRDGGKGTEIVPLIGSQSLIQADFVNYFQTRLYQSLNVPLGRMRPETGFSLGRTNEITREELKFNKFVGRLRLKFSGLFHQLLRIQLIAKGLIRADEWDEIKEKIRYDFIKDNHFTEMKESELLQNRLNNLTMIDPFVGKYYSKNWVQKQVLRMDDEEIEEVNSQIEEEAPEEPPVDAMPPEDDQAAEMQQQQFQTQQDWSQQQAEQDAEAHEQEMRHNEELHKQKLKGK